MKLHLSWPPSILSLADLTTKLCPLVQQLLMMSSNASLMNVFGKIKQVIIIADDIMTVAYRPDHSNHDQAFTNLLQAAKECNVKLNYDRLQNKQNEVEFFGETCTTNGHKTSKDKVAAITSMPSPTNKKQVQSFIGMINYLAKFSLRLSELAEPIRKLVKDKVPFNWDPELQEAFTRMKKEIANAPLCSYYNHKKHTTLQTDASITKCGACLLQDSKPVYFASKALTDAQKVMLWLSWNLLQ